MKKKGLFVAGVCALAVLAGCASFTNNYYDKETTVFLPDGTVQWAPKMDYWSDNSVTRGDLSKEEYLKKARDYISWVARSSKAELEQAGKKIFQNPDAEGSMVYQHLEARLRTLPPGTRMVLGFWSNKSDKHSVFAVGYLSDDGSYINYVVED